MIKIDVGNIARKRIEFFDYKGDFGRHLMFEKGMFVIAVALFIGAGVIFLVAAKICEGAIDRYNASIVDAYQSIQYQEAVIPSKARNKK
ncbi:MAG: hypothetical protein V1893_00490 [Candidatus Omnitrophota bacterium]